MLVSEVDVSKDLLLSRKFTTRVMESPVGTLILCASQTDLRLVRYASAGDLAGLAGVPQPAVNEILDAAEAELLEYFVGARKSFSVPWHIDDSEFQLRVWQALCDVPYGTTVSYAELARAVDAPRAVRAVGAALGRNPLWIILPCHRVIAARGRGIGGYAGGSDMKRRLLDLEAAACGGNN